MSELKYPLVCFDLDGTLVDDTIFIWKTLHETFRTDTVSRKKASEAYFSGKISYVQWFEHDLELLDRAGANREQMVEAVSTLKKMPGADDLLAELKSRGHKLAIISGSLDLVVQELYNEIMFDHILINRIDFDQYGKIRGGTATPYDFAGKAKGLEYLASKENIPLRRTAFVGDNSNDLWIAKAAGLSIAFNCKSDDLKEVCNVVVEEKDLRLLGSVIE